MKQGPGQRAGARTLGSPTAALTVLWAALIPISGIRVISVGSLADILLGALLVFWGIKWLASGQRDTVAMCFGLASSVAFALIISMLASYHSVAPAESDANVAKLTFAVFGALFISTSIVRDAVLVGQVAGALGLGCTVLAGSVWFYGSSDSNGRLTGLGVHPVGTGSLVAIGLAVFAFLPTRSGWRAVGKWVCVAIMISSFVGAVTLSGALAVPVGVLTAAVVFRRVSYSAVLRLTIAAVAVLGVLYKTSGGAKLVDKLTATLSPASDAVIRVPGQFSTFDYRIQSITAGVTRIRDHEITGNGLDLSGTLSVGDTEPHNIFILAWQTGGLLLFVFYTGLFVYFAWRLLRIASSSASSTFTGWEVGLVASGVTAWVVAFTAPALYQRGLIFPIVVAIVIVRRRRVNPARPAEAAESSPGRATRQLFRPPATRPNPYAQCSAHRAIRPRLDAAIDAESPRSRLARSNHSMSWVATGTPNMAQGYRGKNPIPLNSSPDVEIDITDVYSRVALVADRDAADPRSLVKGRTRLLRDSGWSLLLNVLSKAQSAAILAAGAITGGFAGIGTVTVAVGSALLASALADFGLSSEIARYVSTYPSRPAARQVLTKLGARVPLAGVLAVGVLLVTRADVIHSPAGFAMTCVYAAGLTGTAAGNAALYGLRQFRYSSVVLGTVRFGASVVAIVLTIELSSAIWLLVAFGSFEVLVAVFLIVRVWRSTGGDDAEAPPVGYRHLWLGIGGAVNVLVNQSDVLLVSLAAGPTTVGIYSVGSQLENGVGTLAVSGSAPLTVHIAGELKAGRSPGSLIKSGLRATVAMSTGASALILIAYFLLRVSLPNAAALHSGTVLAVTICCLLGAIASSPAVAFLAVLVGANRPKHVALIRVVNGVVSAAGLLLLTHLFGVAGLLTAVLIRDVSLLLMSYVSQRQVITTTPASVPSADASLSAPT